MRRDLTVGETAHVDQVVALIRDVEREWPYNEALIADSECERVVLERLGDTWEGMRADRCYLLWGHGRMVELPLANSMVITATALNTAPTGGECDRCRCVTTLAGVAVVAVPRNLVPLVLCWACVEELNPESLLQTGASHA
ncbi:hypothetical protein [Nocardioides sp. LHG3406-4]|uniref:hypothetical protein n=1 Tax=Nocardioides sp. LHG3406-4 TaxID=2804575 RepID=UPI003CF94C94